MNKKKEKDNHLEKEMKLLIKDLKKIGHVVEEDYNDKFKTQKYIVNFFPKRRIKKRGR